MDDLHDFKFPGESEQYRQTRNQLLEEELALRTRLAEISALRKKLPMGGKVKEDYVFEELHNGQVKNTRFSQLFAEGKDSLIIYNFMYSATMNEPCPMCTSILDSVDGSSPHVNQRANLVIVAKSSVKRIVEFANSRNWDNLRLLSSEKNSFNRDYYGEDSEGGQWPACNVFVKRDDGIFHFYATEMLFLKSDIQPRHVDLMWPLWNFLDLTPEGRGEDWYPKLDY